MGDFEEKDKRANLPSDEGSLDGNSSRSIDTEPLSYSALINDDDESDGLRDCDVCNLLSFDGIRRPLNVLEGSNPGKANEVIKTDKQLMMVLKELSSQECIGADQEGELMIRKNSISFPEFWHCYKTVVNGMLVMQMLPTSQNVKSNAMFLHRNRTRERVLMMVKAFSDGESTVENENSKMDKLNELIEKQELLLTRQRSKYAKEINDLCNSIQSIETSRKHWRCFALITATAVMLLAGVFAVRPEQDLSITDRNMNVNESMSNCFSSEEMKIIDHQKQVIQESVHKINVLSAFEVQNKDCRLNLEHIESLLKNRTKDLQECDENVNCMHCTSNSPLPSSNFKPILDDHQFSEEMSGDNFISFENDYQFSDEHALPDNAFDVVTHVANKNNVRRIVSKRFFPAKIMKKNFFPAKIVKKQLLPALGALGGLGGIGGATMLAPKVAALAMKTGAFSWIVRGITIIGESMVHFFLP